MIAVKSAMKAPLSAFLLHLAVPTLVNLALTPLVLAKIYGLKIERVAIGYVPQEFIRNRRDALLAVLALTVGAFVVNDIKALQGGGHIVNIGLIPFVAAALVYFFASSPREILSKVDWGTVLFFISMFIAMRGIWEGGVIQEALKAVLPSYTGAFTDILAITFLSIALSQILSNVPFVELFSTYLQTLGHVDDKAWITLAMASTVAGNLTLLGAASNIIILEALETRHGQTITFTQFAKVGSIVTALNLAIYLPYIYLNTIYS